MFCSSEITALGGIIYASVSDVHSTVYTTRYPSIPDCAVSANKTQYLDFHPQLLRISTNPALYPTQNNCTSTSPLASQCPPHDSKCVCSNPDSLNVYGPYVEVLCNETDRNSS